MKTLLFYFKIFTVFLFLVGCQKTNIGQNGTVDIYLIDKYTRLDQSCGIDNQSVSIQKKPLIAYIDLLSYDPKTYTFQLSDQAAKTVKNLNPQVSGLPFAVKANNELIYTGYFWPSYSSASCQWVVIDPVILVQNRMEVKLGYPGTIEGENIPDKRNDKRITNIFNKDNKLK